MVDPFSHLQGAPHPSESGWVPLTPAVPSYPPQSGAVAPPYPGLPFGAPPAWRPLPALPLGLATATVVLAALWMALQILSWALSFSAADAYRAAADLGRPASEVFTAYDNLALPMFPVMVAAWIVGCLWLQACRGVVQVVAPMVRQERGPVWVWLGWIIPVVALWFPYQVVRDVLRGAGVRAGAALGWWWAAWLVFSYSGNQAAFSTAGLSRYDPASVPRWETVTTIAALASGVLWIVMVLRVRHSHEQLRRG